MPNVFDQFDDADDSGAPIAGLALDQRKGDRLRSADRLRQAWPGRPLSDAELGIGPPRRAGLAGAGLPPGYVIDQAQPSARKLVPVEHNPFDRFDPDKYLAGLPDAPWANKGGIFDDLIPKPGSAQAYFGQESKQL